MQLKNNELLKHKKKHISLITGKIYSKLSKLKKVYISLLSECTVLYYVTFIHNFSSESKF